MFKSGEEAAQLAMDMIRGGEAGIGKVLESPNVYCVDANVMEQFELDMEALPEGTEIINYKPTFWERNQEAIVPAGILTLILVSVIGIFYYDNVRRRKLMGELEEARKIMESASQHDFLTGLPNRSKFMDDLEAAIEAKMPCTVMMIDIDDFKGINDTYGHLAGDKVIIDIAHVLTNYTQNRGFVGRIGGDEFLVYMPNILDTTLACETAENYVNELRALYPKADGKPKVTLSIGIAATDTSISYTDFVENADKAVYQAKLNGKDGYVLYDKSLERVEYHNDRK